MLETGKKTTNNSLSAASLVNLLGNVSIRLAKRCLNMLPFGIQWKLRAYRIKILQKRYANINSKVIPKIAVDGCLDTRFGIGIEGLVSIVLPVYNQATLLKEAILGVLGQTYENCELIIVNDGSTDDVESVLKQFLQNPKIKIINHKKNRGLPQALNTGFLLAKGEFLTWTSADNIMLPQHIERHVHYLQEHPDIAMVYSDYIAIDDAGNPLIDPSFRPHNKESWDSPVIRLPRSTEQLNIVKDNFIGPCFMYRAWVAKVIGAYDELLMGAEDYDYWMRINSLFKLAHLGTDEILYKYRVHANTLNAKAEELGIFERVDRLMDYDKQRREFYEKPFNIYLDETSKKWLLGTDNPWFENNQFYSIDELCKKSDKFTKQVVIISEHSLHWLKDFYPQKNICVVFVISSDAFITYGINDSLWEKIDICLALNDEGFLRARIFRDDVFSVSNKEQSLMLILAASNIRLFNKINESRGIIEKDNCYRNIRLWQFGKRKLKVVLQVDRFDKGGLEKVVYNLALCFRDLNVDPIVCVADYAGFYSRRAPEAGIKVIDLKNDREKYRNMLISEDIDLVNAHYSTFGLDIACELGIPIVQTIHNSYAWFDPEQVQLYRKLDSLTSRYICVSKSVAKYSEARLGLSVSRLFVVPNGLDIKELAEHDYKEKQGEIRRELGVQETDFLFLCTSNFFAHKMQHLIVRALSNMIKQCPNVKVAFLGSASDEKYYKLTKQTVEGLGLQNNTLFLGFQENPYMFYSAADAFILPSLWEGWSLALAEALYFGLPVVATDVGSARELIDESGFGILIPAAAEVSDIYYGNVASIILGANGEHESLCKNLTNAMIEMTERRYTRQDRERARKLIVQKYNAERMARQYLNHFIDLVINNRKTKGDKNWILNL
jgi:glycosyltransferase involved in cell wall biosynthesis